jgi:hypothetical protein
VGDIGEDGVRKSTVKANQTAAAMQNLTDVVKELNDLKPALLATPTPGALSSATPNYPTPKDGGSRHSRASFHSSATMPTSSGTSQNSMR